MDEYISRAKLEFDFMQCNGTNSKWTPQRVVQMIHRQPTADVAPVRHGKWIKVGYACGETEWQCTSCKETEWRTSSDRLKYCPFCGAKMDLEI